MLGTQNTGIFNATCVGFSTDTGTRIYRDKGEIIELGPMIMDARKLHLCSAS